MIKYLGSKRRLVGVLGAMAEAIVARTAVDGCTGTTRVAQEFKRRGVEVWAVDSARYAAVLAGCYVATDARRLDVDALDAALAALGDLPGRRGYVTRTFCEEARYFQPANGERIDAMRDAIEAYRGSPLYDVLLTSLLEAADRVDSTTGVQMAYLKSWAARSYRPLELRRPVLLPGAGHALQGDIVALLPALPAVDLAYLDPPYNQHRYYTNYHVWETLVAWDAPAHYGRACKRLDARDPATRSAFNSRGAAREAVRRAVGGLDARLLVVSCSNEGWVDAEDIAAMSAARGTVRVLAFDSKRYVGAQIGIHNRRGERVGSVSHLRNVEYLVLSGDRDLVEAAADAAAAASPASVKTPPATIGNPSLTTGLAASVPSERKTAP